MGLWASLQVINTSGLELNGTGHWAFPPGRPISQPTVPRWPESTEQHCGPRHPLPSHALGLEGGPLCPLLGGTSRPRTPEPRAPRLAVTAGWDFTHLSKSMPHTGVAQHTYLFFLKRNKLKRKTIKRNACAFSQFILVLNVETYIHSPNFSCRAETLCVSAHSLQNQLLSYHLNLLDSGYHQVKQALKI